VSYVMRQCEIESCVEEHPGVKVYTRCAEEAVWISQSGWLGCQVHRGTNDVLIGSPQAAERLLRRAKLGIGRGDRLARSEKRLRKPTVVYTTR